MQIKLFDFIVIILYLLLVSLLGIMMKRQAERSKKDYLLGGNSIPFWMLGVSNASGMFDISGTAWMVAIMVIYGVKSIWLPWLWPVFNQVFLMVYLSVWLRRSNASTGAEWMLIRFGTNKDSQLSHKVIIAFALISCLSFMAYGFIGLGKFIEIFIPWSVVSPYLPFQLSPAYVPHFYGIIFTVFTVFYSLLGGMKSIVWADVIHYVIMVVVSVSIAAIAMNTIANHTFHVPLHWDEISFGWQLNLDWRGIIDEVDTKIKADGFSPFGYFFALMTAKGILASLAGPTPNYDMQKILSTKSPREAALMSMIVNVVLLPTRYLFIIGVAILGIVFYDKLNILGANGTTDFERILPAALNTYIPAGLLGLTLVGLMGAFMGTFAGTFNAAQAYLVNDVYLKSINPKATNTQITKMNYVLGLTIVVISIMLGYFAKDVNSILQWIVSALYGGYIASNVLKWHWWRFNSYGFFGGMLSGIISSMVLPVLLPNNLPLYYFPLILVISIVGSVAGTLLTPATDIEVLKSFYKNVRPWGFWKPIQKLVEQENPNFKANQDFWRDMLNVVIGIIAQTTLTALPVYIVLMKPTQSVLAIVILAVCSIILWKTWYQKLPEK